MTQTISNTNNGTEYKGIIYTKSQVAAMREWVADCQWDDDTNDLSDLEIIRGVARHFEGGLTEFINTL